MNSQLRVGHVSTFPPLRCGIAIYASDLVDSMVGVVHERYGLHYGCGPFSGEGHADVNSRDEVVSLARRISVSACDVVLLHHEFGIWGGADGEHLQPFLDHLTKPLVSVLHTTFGPHTRSAVQVAGIVALLQRSDRVVLFTPTAFDRTQALLGRVLTNALVIPHGVHRYPYEPAPTLDADEPLRLVTPGFFRENKGFEVLLDALHMLRSEPQRIFHWFLGEPQSQFSRQGGYLQHIEQLASVRGLEDSVRFEVRFLPVAEQVAAIHRAHAGLFPYQDASQASSGTVPLVLSSGRPAVCTPFEYACAKRDEGLGVEVADGFDARSLAEAIKRLRRRMQVEPMGRDTYDRTADWDWTRVAVQFREQLAAVAGVADPATEGR